MLMSAKKRWKKKVRKEAEEEEEIEEKTVLDLTLDHHSNYRKKLKRTISTDGYLCNGTDTT